MNNNILVFGVYLVDVFDTRPLTYLSRFWNHARNGS